MAMKPSKNQEKPEDSSRFRARILGESLGKSSALKQLSEDESLLLSDVVAAPWPP